MQEVNGMDAERWERIEALFFGALERGAPERAAFLDVACADDAALREEVDAMLAAHEHGGRLLLEQRFLADAPVSVTGPDALLGTPIGAYRLKERIGQGGMGTVYLAERTDGGFQQQVALKLIRYGMDRDDVLLRFLNERQILAQLQHPNIARLLDGGVTENGQPYFAMEYVEGEPIDAYCDTGRLAVEERLALFVEAVEAVQYAHQNLVVHRDLKPSNLLVTEEGAVRLLDFGIAKLIEASDEAPALTRTGMRVMTPEYASPEQVRGEPVTTASDVYQLGVLLYELLTGRRPYQLEALTPGAIERVICEAEPEKPSTAVSRVDETGATPEQISQQRATHTERLRRRLMGDLDTICLKALQKEPARRYASAEAFVDDVKRHLAGLPVKARPNTLGYRVRTFVRRHRIGVGAAALVVLSLVGGLAVALWQARVAAAERDRAQLEAEKAEQVATFLTDLFASPNPAEARGDTLTAYDLMRRGLERVDQDLTEQPLVRATLLNTLGNTYASMGEYGLATPLLDTALALRQTHLGPSRELAQVMGDLGWTKLMDGDFARAESLYTASLTLQRDLLGEKHEDVAGTLERLAGLKHEMGDHEASERFYRQAIDRMRQLYTAPRPEYASALQHLALLLRQTGRPDEAASLMEEALEVQRALVRPPHPNLALMLNDYGLILKSLDQRAEAEAALREAIDMQRQLFGREHPQLVYTLANLATTVRAQNVTETDQLTREAVQIARSVFGATNPVLSNVLTLRAGFLQRQGALQEAQVQFEEGLAVARQAYPEGHPRIGWAQVGLGSVLLERGQASEAEPLIRAGWQMLIAAFGRDHSLTQQAEARLAEVLDALGRSDERDTLRAPTDAPPPAAEK